MRTINVPEEGDLKYPNNIDSCVSVLRELELIYGSSVFRLSMSILQTDYLINHLNSFNYNKY